MDFVYDMMGSAIWIRPLVIGAFLGGGEIIAVDSVAWTAWALSGWYGYAGRAEINCVDRTAGD